jgi:PAS domain S-box-containing protein
LGVEGGVKEIRHKGGEASRAAVALEDVLGVPGQVASALAACLDSLPFYVMLVDEGHQILFANRATQADLGLAPDEVFGTYCPRAVHGLDEPVPGCPLEEALAVGHLVERELLDPATGRWVSSGVYPLALEAAGRRRVFLHFVRDITHERHAEQDVARERDMNAIVAEMLLLALDDVALELVLERTLERLIGIPWLSVEARGGIFLVEGEPPRLVLKAQRDLPSQAQADCRTVPFGRCLCGRAAASGRLEFADDLDERHELCAESLRPHGHYCMPIVSQDRVLGVINLYLQAGHPRDAREESFLRAVANVLAGIIERRRAEARLRQAQKLEALGTLAAGVAHDFNNLLTVIQGHAEALREESGTNESRRRHADRIKSVVKRGAELARQLVAFGRTEPAHTDVIVVDSVVRGVRKMLASLIPPRIGIEADLDGPPARVRIDRGQLEQVLVNLAINARDAMPAEGRLRIATGQVELGPGRADAPPGPYVSIGVSDTGMGIAPELVARIFEPFFTTKGPGRGSGLGLAIVDKIVREAGGHVRVTSVMGQGSTFTVYLPVARADGPGRTAKRTSPDLTVIDPER